MDNLHTLWLKKYMFASNTQPSSIQTSSFFARENDAMPVILNRGIDHIILEYLNYDSSPPNTYITPINFFGDDFISKVFKESAKTILYTYSEDTLELVIKKYPFILLYSLSVDYRSSQFVHGTLYQIALGSFDAVRSNLLREFITRYHGSEVATIQWNEHILKEWDKKLEVQKALDQNQIQVFANFFLRLKEGWFTDALMLNKFRKAQSNLINYFNENNNKVNSGYLFNPDILLNFHNTFKNNKIDFDEMDSEKQSQIVHTINKCIPYAIRMRDFYQPLLGSGDFGNYLLTLYNTLMNLKNQCVQLIEQNKSNIRCSIL